MIDNIYVMSYGLLLSYDIELLSSLLLSQDHNSDRTVFICIHIAMWLSLCKGVNICITKNITWHTIRISCTFQGEKAYRRPALKRAKDFCEHNTKISKIVETPVPTFLVMVLTHTLRCPPLSWGCWPRTPLPTSLVTVLTPALRGPPLSRQCWLWVNINKCSEIEKKITYKQKNVILVIKK